MIGWVYCVATIAIARLFYYIDKADVTAYNIITSKKSYLQLYFFLVAFICATITYQNIFKDWSPYIMWWRLGLTVAVTSLALKWGQFAKKVIMLTDQQDYE